MAQAKLERTLASLRSQAEEYAESGKDFPLTGSGSLMGYLDDLESCVSKTPKQSIGKRSSGLGAKRPLRG